jgi:hypothetical protein
MCPRDFAVVQFYQRYRPVALRQFEQAAKECRAQRLAGRDMERVLADAVVRGVAVELLDKRTAEGMESISREEWKALPLREQLGRVGLQLGKTKVFFRLQAFEEAEVRAHTRSQQCRQTGT